MRLTGNGVEKSRILMASITLCPRCSSHLELPIGVAPTSLIECPICEAEFLLASVAPRAIPRARVVEQQVGREVKEVEPVADEPSLPLYASPTFGVVVDEEAESSEPATTDNLSRLLRSSGEWQLPGVHVPAEDQEETAAVEEDEESSTSLDLNAADERVIPNDHAASATPFGVTFDAAYRDADPELASESPAQSDDLKLGSSRLDQLLSDLMKSPVAPTSSPTIEVSSSSPAPKLPRFAEFEPHDEGAEEEPTHAELSEAGQDFDEVEVLDAPEDRWRRLRESAAQEEQLSEVAEEFADEEASDDDEQPLLQLETTPRRKRRPAGLRTLVGVVGGGAIGILGGAYALLWLRGSDGDVLHMANLLPPAMLPPSMQPLLDERSQENNQVAVEASANTPPTDDSGSIASPETTTLEFAESPDEPTAEQGAAAGEAELAAAPDETRALHQDAAVMPAAATEPAEDTSATPTVADAVVETEADAPKHWPTTPIVGQLRNAPRYTVADLDALLIDADAAHRRFLAGDLSRKDDVAAMGQAYIELCKLAERFTLTDPAEFGNELITKQMNAKNIFRGTVGLPARRNDLAMIAGRWLQHSRRPNQGVVLLGKVTDLRAQGPWTEYTIETPLGDSTAVSKVLMDGVPFASGAEVAVVGTVIADPRQTITGYEGEAPQVIVSGFAFVPEEFTAPKISDLDEEVGDLFSGG
jgi:hypothetical protein